MWCQVAPGPPWRQRSGSLPSSSPSPTNRYHVRYPAKATNPSLTGSAFVTAPSAPCDSRRETSWWRAAGDRSFSGLLRARTVWTRSSAMSTEMTRTTRSSRSRNRAPGCPLISASRNEATRARPPGHRRLHPVARPGPGEPDRDMELQRDEYSVLSFNPETQALELWWSAGSASLTEERFRQGLEQFAGQAVERRTPNLLVGLREFAYRPAPDMWDWRLEHFIPRYREAGVRKFANIVPEGWPLGGTTNEQEGFPHPQRPHRGGSGGLVPRNQIG